MTESSQEIQFVEHVQSSASAPHAHPKIDTVIISALMVATSLAVILAIPMSLLGTIAVIYFCGFTLNTFTLLGLSLAVGLALAAALCGPAAAQQPNSVNPTTSAVHEEQLLQQFSALREASALPEDAAGRAQVLAQCHKLAGSAGIVGALALGELARRAERAGRQDDWPQVQAGLEDIALALSALAEAASRLNTE